MRLRRLSEQPQRRDDQAADGEHPPRKVQTLQRCEPLVDLPELDFDSPKPVVHAPQILLNGSDLHPQVGPDPADLDARREDRVHDDANDHCASRLGMSSDQHSYGPSLPAASSARDPVNMLNIP